MMFGHGRGMMIGPVLFGAIARHWSLDSAFWSGGVLNIAIIVLCYPLMRTVISAPVIPAMRKQESVVTD